MYFQRKSNVIYKLSEKEEIKQPSSAISTVKLTSITVYFYLFA